MGHADMKMGPFYFKISNPYRQFLLNCITPISDKNNCLASVFGRNKKKIDAI